MKHPTQTTTQTDAVRRLRAGRSADALVARYLLELSGRHGHGRPVNRTEGSGAAPFRARELAETLA